MKQKLLIFFSILQLIIPLLSAIIMTFFEKELLEAIISGALIGWIISAVIGVILLILNRKYKNLVVMITSILAIIPACIFGMLFLMYNLYA